MIRLRRLASACALTLPVAACTDSRLHDAAGETSSRPAREGVALSVDATRVPAATPIVLSEAVGGVQRATAPNDSTTRLRVWARGDDSTTAIVCGALASGSTHAVPRSGGANAEWRVDSAAPVLATRVLTNGDVTGLRYLVPGASAWYVFEGISRSGRHRVSMRWPITADPARPVPVGAPDSVVEAAIVPAVSALDSVVSALVDTEASGMVSWPTAPRPGRPVQAGAVLDIRPLPVHRAALSPACPDVTLALPMLARADHTIKIPVNTGDVITADASAENGAVRIAFDEAAPVTDDSDEITHAQLQATRTGDLTLRVRLIVRPKVQLSRQTVLVRLQRTRP